MTQLLEQAIAIMDELPEQLQDRAARQIMQYVDENSDPDDRFAIADGPEPFERRDP